MATIQYPENADLRSLLRFAAEDGLIWLGEHRMLLLHAGAMAELRKELIESVGREQARLTGNADEPEAHAGCADRESRGQIEVVLHVSAVRGGAQQEQKAQHEHGADGDVPPFLPLLQTSPVGGWAGA